MMWFAEFLIYSFKYIFNIWEMYTDNIRNHTELDIKTIVICFMNDYFNYN
jgi:hypothetical protein